MARALKLAENGLYSTSPNPRVGCLLVKNNTVVGEGWHVQAGGDHAEVMALKQAGANAEGAECYVTLEPCIHTGKTPPCTPQLINAGIKKAIIAMIDPNPKVNGKGIEQLRAAGIETSVGLLEQDAQQLNSGFVKRMTHGMPYVRIKLAISLDGRTALADGTSQWITGEAARSDVQKLRAQSCAILTGIGTVLADDPLLTVREIDTLQRHPVRVVIDRQLRTPATARLFSAPGPIVIMTSHPDKNKYTTLVDKGATVVLIEDDHFLKGCLQHLAAYYHANEVLIEAGAKLCGSFLEAGLVDELVVYQAPVMLGHTAKPMFELDGINRMDKIIRLNLTDMKPIGQDVRLTYRFNRE